MLSDSDRQKVKLHGVQRRMISMAIFCIFEGFFCFGVAICDLVHDVCLVWVDA